jgi:hypothetical protein
MANIPFWKDPDLYRRQNMWLVLALVCESFARFVPVASLEAGGTLLTYHQLADAKESQMLNVLMVLIGVSVILTVYMLFDYKSLKQQLGSCLALGIINLTASIIGMVFYAKHFGVFYFLLPLAALFCILAWLAVRSDLRKLKSADRLR